MAKNRSIAYLRVSTQRQGASGLGLEAQRTAVMTYLNGAGAELLAEYVEVESGKRNDRPELAKALKSCRLMNATLVIAKIDRLARNAAFLLSLIDAGVDFVAADMPNANRLTVGVMAMVAEDEAERISARTKAALAAAKARGVVLGNPNLQPGTATSAAIARAARSTATTAKAAEYAEVIVDLQHQGHQSLRDLAEGLNARGFPAPRGGTWQATTVKRLLARLPTPD